MAPQGTDPAPPPLTALSTALSRPTLAVIPHSHAAPYTFRSLSTFLSRAGWEAVPTGAGSAIDVPVAAAGRASPDPYLAPSMVAALSAQLNFENVDPSLLVLVKPCGGWQS